MHFQEREAHRAVAMGSRRAALPVKSFCLEESLPIGDPKTMAQNKALEGHAICEGRIVLMQSSPSAIALLSMLLPKVREALHVWHMSCDGASRRDLVAIIKLSFTFFVHAPPSEAATFTGKGPCLWVTLARSLWGRRW